MWDFCAAIFNIVANWFRAKKKEERQEILETANESGKISAEIARKTEQAIEHDTTEAHKQTDDAIADLRSADSVRKQNRITSDAIDSANSKLR